MKNDNKKNKTLLIIGIITTILLLTLGITYAAFSYMQTGEDNHEVVLGDIYMHYQEKNQLLLENAMPSSFKLNTLKLPSVVTGYTVNPVMKDQELNTLSRCIGFYSSRFFRSIDEGSTYESFCRNQGTLNGKTLQENLNDGEMPQMLMADGYDDIYIQEGENYIPNPIMQNQEVHELTVCVNHFNSYQPFDEGSDEVSFCQGTGSVGGGITFHDFIEIAAPPIEDWKNTNLIIQDGDTYIPNPVMQTQTVEGLELSNCMYNLATIYNPELAEGSTLKSYCKGEGTTVDGKTFQEYLDGLPIGAQGTSELLTVNAIIEDTLPEVEYSYTNLIVNPNMEGEVLESCKTIITDLQELRYASKDIEGFCKGTAPFFGPTFTSGKLISELATDTAFLQGDGHQLLRNRVIITDINSPYFEFTISGKNTYSKKDIYYDVVLTHGDNHETRTERIRDDLLRFTLTEVDSKGNEISLVKNISLTDLKNGERIYVETIPKNTMDEINKTYRLYMNIANSTVICGGEVSKSCDYYTDADKTPNWNDVFASVKINVTGDFSVKELPRYFVDDFKDIVESKSGTSVTDTDGTIYLSGNNDMLNYNYVLYSGKIWRITSLYSDGTMKLVTEDAASESIWGSDDGKFINSSVYTYLNNDFLDTLDNYKNVIVTDYDWDVAEFVTSNEIADAEYVTAPLGLINSYEYYMSYQNANYTNGYLAVNYDWWILNNKTLITSSTYSAYSFVRSSGLNPSFDYSYTNFQKSNSIRPSIVLKPNVLVSDGDGSYDNPYVINTGNN